MAARSKINTYRLPHLSSDDCFIKVQSKEHVEDVLETWRGCCFRSEVRQHEGKLSTMPTAYKRFRVSRSQSGDLITGS